MERPCRAPPCCCKRKDPRLLNDTGNATPSDRNGPSGGAKGHPTPVVIRHEQGQGGQHFMVKQDVEMASKI